MPAVPLLAGYPDPDADRGVLLMGAKWTRHTFCAGRTGSGKSYLAAGECRAWDGPVLVIDRKLCMSGDLGWPTADRTHRTADILRYLGLGPGDGPPRRGGLCYVPHWDYHVARAECDLLIRALFACGPHDPALLLVVDEAWRVAREGDRPGQVHRVAVEGRASGIQGYFISQRPADVSKDVVTQCDRMIIFDTSFEGPWMQRYGIDHAGVTAQLKAAPQYSYVVWDGDTIQGPRRESR